MVPFFQFSSKDSNWGPLYFNIFQFFREAFKLFHDFSIELVEIYLLNVLKFSYILLEEN